jgi:hypothetical protein
MMMDGSKQIDTPTTILSSWWTIPTNAATRVSQMLQEHSAPLSHTQEIFDAFLERRQEDFNAMVEAARQMGAGQDLTVFGKAYGDWLNGCLKRLQADLSDMHEHGQEFVAVAQRSMWRPKPATDGLGAKTDDKTKNGRRSSSAHHARVRRAAQ